MVPMETPAGIPPSNDGDLVKSCFMLFFVCLLVLPPAEEEEDGQCEDDADTADTGAEGGPIELHEGCRLSGLIDDAIVIGLPLFCGLGRRRTF